MFPLIIEPEQLANRLQDPDLLVVDLCRPESYTAGHVPGAVYVSPSDLMSGIRPAVGKLPELDRLNSLFASIGYHPEKQIVAYDDEGGGWAGRFIWTLDVIGHKASSYLNGGLHAWSALNLPLNTEAPSINPTSVDAKIDHQFIAEKEDVLQAIGDSNIQIWDARSAEEYNGTKVVSQRGGHIPGAINLDWLDTMDRDNHLRLRTDMEALLESRGFSKQKSIITHCQSHHRSGLTYLIGKMLGYNIQAYPGSWSEWGNDPDTPVETS
jgi:thiosulfate/3-mercaptopyruvate sulfurtransferase